MYPRTLAALLLLAIPVAGTALELAAQRVAEGVYALVGSTGPRTAGNHALNNNLGFVVTDEGVVLIDSGASALGARAVEAAVAEVTAVPVRWVINTGSQDHRWLGNGYFAGRGARIIALGRTVETQRRFADEHMTRLQALLGPAFEGTTPVYADEILDEDRASLVLGNVPLELRWHGDAHFPGDAVVWLPESRIVFTGDVVYVDRMLGVHPWSRVAGWREAFAAVEGLAPAHVVPGHGRVSDMARARRDTGDYLDWLAEEVGAAARDWEPLEEVTRRLGTVPRFQHLEHYDSWHRTNVNRAYLEFEGS